MVYLYCSYGQDKKHNFSVPASCPLIWFSPNLLLFSNRIVCFCFPINQKLNLNCSGVLPKLSGHFTFIYEITKVNINSKWSKKRFLFAPKPFFSQNKLVTRKLSKLPANIIYLRAKWHNIREPCITPTLLVSVFEEVDWTGGWWLCAVLWARTIISLFLYSVPL